MANHRILLAIDGTRASERAVRYVGEVLGTDATHVRLLHVVPALPLERRDVPGFRAPAEGREARTEEAFGSKASARARRARPILERMRAVLLDEGFRDEQLELDLRAGAPEESVPRVVLEQARQHDCDTIVVGYRKLPWYRQLFYRHVGEWLVRHANEQTVCVVE